jgi:hypothetical protein
MGTRADFYVGRGTQAEWIGSIAFDGYPSGIDKQVLNCTGTEAFRHAVAHFLSGQRSRSLPADGWPWPWPTSATTDYAYAIDGDAVWASCFGGAWFDPTKEPLEDDDEIDDRNSRGPLAVFPDMSKIPRRSLLGPHSGLIVLGR